MLYIKGYLIIGKIMKNSTQTSNSLSSTLWDSFSPILANAAINFNIGTGGEKYLVNTVTYNALRSTLKQEAAEAAASGWLWGTLKAVAGKVASAVSPLPLLDKEVINLTLQSLKSSGLNFAQLISIGISEYFAITSYNELHKDSQINILDPFTFSFDSLKSLFLPQAAGVATQLYISNRFGENHGDYTSATAGALVSAGLTTLFEVGPTIFSVYFSKEDLGAVGQVIEKPDL